MIKIIIENFQYLMKSNMIYYTPSMISNFKDFL